MDAQLYLIKKSKAFVSSILLPVSGLYPYHNLEHTRGVVKAARIIGRASHLTEEQLGTVIIAAWFHDLDYYSGASYHEERSASIAGIMLTTWGAGTELVKNVSRGILATKLPQNPTTITDKVLCDADLANLGSTQYELHASRLRIELETRQGFHLESEQAWCQRNIEILKSHHFFTDYGQTILERRKEVNLKRIKRRAAGQFDSITRGLSAKTYATDLEMKGGFLRRPPVIIPSGSR